MLSETPRGPAGWRSTPEAGRHASGPGVAWRRPLLASGLERGLEVAEAMTARGYGAGPRTQLPAALPRLVERLVYVPSAALVVIAAALVHANAAGFRFYDTLGPVATGPAVLATAVAVLALATTAALLERWTPPA